ncbi:SGNH/GDSL hydrolase family protein [Mucilaginibacter calamicampi]|uniref:SGNH/GDSL hydrolase family protein n=1 Tax=Mucilaginibacter calamicampi TaxID=1302352 RepID=A0ABW2Z1Z8_9SPHI
MQRILLAVLLLLTFAGCNKQPAPPFPPAYRILVLGNSITYSPANPSIGWHGSWGMAASVADSDFVHVFTKRLKEINPANEVLSKNIAEFEVNFDTYNFDANLKTLRDAKPALIVLRIGENVTRNTEAALFEQKYQELLNYFKTDNPSVKILAVGSVWPDRDMPTNVMKKYSEFVPLVFMQNDLSNYAFGKFTDPGVASHPSDKGMATIAYVIFKSVQQTLYGK